ncbi:MAG: hypothetical protein Q8P12_07900, partial [bacterium]|nr:hypothetical protein [bacterium]
HGKTLLALLITALAQEQGAKVTLVDLENSEDEDWIRGQGINYDELLVIKPKIGVFDKKVPDGFDAWKKDKQKKWIERNSRLETAQEVCAEAEMRMESVHESDPEGKQIVIVDSAAMILVEEEAEAGLTGQNMRTSQARASFLYKLLRRWNGLAFNYNCMIIFINHLLVKPGKVYGSPFYRPAGDALNYGSSVMVEIRRGKDLMQGTKKIGLTGILINRKNKAGGGSYEGARSGFTTKFGKREWRFPPVEEKAQEVEE